MRGPDEDVMAEAYEAAIEALQAAYPYLTSDQLSALCYVAGIPTEKAFPWHSDKAASSVTLN